MQTLKVIFRFFQIDGENTFSEIFKALDFISPGATIVAIVGLAILILWDRVLSKKAKIFTLIQGPLVAVAFGIVLFCINSRKQRMGYC